jgi:hypothetical protein
MRELILVKGVGHPDVGAKGGLLVSGRKLSPSMEAWLIVFVFL